MQTQGKVSSPDLYKRVKKVIESHLDPSRYKVFIFGSRTKDSASPRSDLDIGIEGEKELSPRVKFAIIDDLEKIPTLLKFDLVDFKTVSDEFRQEALKNHRMLN